MKEILDLEVTIDYLSTELSSAVRFRSSVQCMLCIRLWLLSFNLIGRGIEVFFYKWFALESAQRQLDKWVMLLEIFGKLQCSGLRLTSGSGVEPASGWISKPWASPSATAATRAATHGETSGLSKDHVKELSMKSLMQINFLDALLLLGILLRGWKQPHFAFFVSSKQRLQANHINFTLKSSS